MTPLIEHIFPDPINHQSPNHPLYLSTRYLRNDFTSFVSTLFIDHLDCLDFAVVDDPGSLLRFPGDWAGADVGEQLIEEVGVYLSHGR